MAELLKIEKNIPIPPRKGTENGTLKSLITSLEVGDSFLMRSSRKANIYEYGKPHGFKFSMRSEGEKIVRVWRLAPDKSTSRARSGREAPARGHVNTQGRYPRVAPWRLTHQPGRHAPDAVTLLFFGRQGLKRCEQPGLRREPDPI